MPWKAGQGVCVSGSVPLLPAATACSRLWDKDKQSLCNWALQMTEKHVFSLSGINQMGKSARLIVQGV